MNWIIENKEWIFSGIGIFILTIILGLFKKRQKAKKIKMNQKSGDNSTNIQIGGNYKS